MFWNKKNVEEKQQFNKLVESSPLKQNISNAENVVYYTPFPGQEYLSFEKSNQHVVILQKKLIELGYEIPGGANGVYGIATVKAVKKYYDDNGLGNNAGNHMGPKAWNRMFGN